MVRPHETRSTSSLLRLIRTSGDAELGQTLIRLAQQAAAEHRAAHQHNAPPRDQAAALREMVEGMSERDDQIGEEVTR